MYQNAYDSSDNHQRSFMGPFLMGVAVGIGAAAMYAMGRNRVFGDAVADGIHNFENKASEVKGRVAEKASHAKDVVVEKVSSVKEAVANRVGGGGNGDNSSTDSQTNNPGSRASKAS